MKVWGFLETPLASADLNGNFALCEVQANKNQPNGYIGADAGGLVPLSRLPASLFANAWHDAGTWNAATNAPALASGAGTPGAAYLVSVAGATALDGIGAWAVGDLAVFDGVDGKWVALRGGMYVALSAVGIANGVAALDGAAHVPAAQLPPIGNAAAAQMPALTLKGNNAASAASPADLTVAQAKALLALTDADISGHPYTVSLSSGPGTLAASQIIAAHAVPIAVVFPANFGTIGIGLASKGGCLVAATAAVTLDIDTCPAASDPTVGGNWTTIGTASIAAGGHAATLATAGGTTKALAAGDLLRVVAPATADATLANVFLTLVGTR
ncbi:MAG: hypothetical protein RQ966_15105 [Acetobacteraceae bacterium]|nr:hypothetical protein [Acetobacteraceae bacterium]